jgi:hypothetical protein
VQWMARLDQVWVRCGRKEVRKEMASGGPPVSERKSELAGREESWAKLRDWARQGTGL